jgi:hypothetical protein
MKCLTRAQGDGIWGQLHDAYFLAEGDGQRLTALYDKLQKRYGKPVFAAQGKELRPISDKPIRAEVVRALRALPKADKVQSKSQTNR